MTRDDVLRAVRDAVERGDVPAGGPSEAAAHGLLDEIPAEYWRRWSEDAARRIRASVEERTR